MSVVTALLLNISKSLFNPFDFTDVLTSLTSPDIGFILGIVIVPFVDKFSELPLDADEK